MATLKTSALISDIAGKIGGGVVKKTKGGLIIKNITIPRRPRTDSQQFARMTIAELSGKWYGLSETLKDMWNRYASLINPQASGFNAFIGLNMALLRARHPDLVFISGPPQEPSTPHSVEGFKGQAMSAAQNKLLWTYPRDPETYVSVYWAVQACFSHKGKESWHLLKTTSSTEGEVTHTHAFPQGFLVSYKAMSIDLYGRQSPETHVVSILFKESGLSPGFYGHAAYGHAYYNG